MLLSGKEAINNEIDSIIGNNTWMLVDLLPGYKPLGCKWIFKRKLKVDRTIEKFKARLLIAMASIHNLIIHHMDVKTAFLNGELDEEVDLTKEFLSSRFSIKDMREAGVILGIRIKHESNGIAISQSHYIKKVLKKFNYFDCTPQAIQRVLKYLKKTMDYKLTYTGYPSVLEGYTDASWINNSEDNSSTSGWVFLLGGAAGKEAKWLRNLIHEILLWSKPITPISIRYDSATTLAKDYSQMYNGKSRHLGVSGGGGGAGRRRWLGEMVVVKVSSGDRQIFQGGLAVSCGFMKVPERNGEGGG
nr:hypothetical protein [Tanacetum cinerariifolium]